MVTAMDVLRYMRALGHQFNGELQAQKLLYYAQAWSLAWDGEPLFDEEIEAWQMGPVVRSVRRALGGRQPQADPDVPLTAQQKKNVEAVLRFYGGMTGEQLKVLSHDESPWKETWGDRPATDTGWDPITPELMTREYTKQSLHGRGPRRSSLGHGSASVGSITSVAAAASRRWERTLALLAE